MTDLLIKLFVKDRKNVQDPKVRDNYATLSSVTGIIANFLLFVGKLIIGILSASVAIIADAFNNIGDAGSSVVMLIGFRLSGKHADKEHPLGHGRLEYITAFIVDVLIIFVGVELFKSSIEKIIEPQATEIGTVTLVFLGVAILVKLWLFFFYGKIAKTINSQAIKGASFDSVSDVIATTLVFISALLSRFAGVNIDGYAGILVAAFIFYTGVKAAKETIDLLLGGAPDKGIVKKISDFVKRYPEVIGIHDVMVHDYGPGRQIISFHAEVSAKSDFSYVHDVIDNIERDFQKEYGYLVTIHLDPIVVDDDKVSEMYDFVKSTVKEVDESFSIHDFRMTYGGNHINLIFDLVIPVDSKENDEEAAEKVEKKIKELRPECNCVIKAEHPYV